MTDQVVMPIARIAVVAGTKLVEVALPTELPLREIVPAVRRLVGDEAPAESGPLSLAPIGGAAFSLDATLDTVGVVDGELLALQPIPPGPAAPGIVEDVADAAVLFSASRLRPWGIEHIRRGARIAVVLFTLAATALGVAHAIVAGGSTALVGVSALAVINVLAGLLMRSPAVSGELSAAALVPIAAAFALAIPGDIAAQLLLASAGVTTWSAVRLLLGTPRIALFTATGLLGIGMALTGAVALLRDVSMLMLGCGLIVFALVVTVRTAQLSAWFARLPMPTIPAPGDPTPAPASTRVLADLPRRVKACDEHQTGLIAAAVLLSVLGSLAVVTDGAGPWGWYVIAAAAVGSLLRARVWDSAPCKAWLLSHPLLLAGALLAIFAADGRYIAALASLGALGLLAAGWVIVALYPTIGSAETYSLPVRRMTGFLAGGIDASLIPVIAYLVGLFTWVLNR